MKLLTAEFRHLVYLNYLVDPALLTPFLPGGLDLEKYNDEHYVSVVGQVVQNAKLLGITLPDHQSFAQIGIQCYVRRRMGKEIRRGVTFLRQIVPQDLTVRVARALGETSFREGATRSEIGFEPGGRDHMDRPISNGVVKYEWGTEANPQRLALRTTGLAQPVAFGPLEHFLAQRTWLYWSLGRRTREVRLEHPEWFCWEGTEAVFVANSATLGLPSLDRVWQTSPESAFLAKGSGVQFRFPRAFKPR